MKTNRSHIFVTLAITAALMSALLTASPAQAGGQVITVDTTTDESLTDGDNENCSIREAFEAANENAPIDDCPAGTGGLDEVHLQTGETYSLSTDGDLNFVGATVLEGNGAAIVQTESFERALANITGPLYSVEINDVVLTGNACGCLGGTLYNGNSVTAVLNDVRVGSGSSGATNGGQIWNDGMLTINRSQIGTFSQGPIITGLGGGIFNTSSGTLSLNQSLVVGNGTIDDGGGIYNDDGNVTIVNSTMSGNVAGEDGAGIYNTGAGGDVKIFYSTITNNRADYAGSG